MTKKYNQTEDYVHKFSNMDKFECASKCLADEACKFGWLHYSGKNTCYFVKKEGSKTSIEDWTLGTPACGVYQQDPSNECFDFC